jgi:hypothetical protein
MSAVQTMLRAVDLMADGTFGIDEAKRFSGLGRTALYGLMNAGELQYVKVGSRRLIPKKSLVELLARRVPDLQDAPLAAR